MGIENLISAIVPTGGLLTKSGVRYDGRVIGYLIEVNGVRLTVPLEEIVNVKCTISEPPALSDSESST